MSRPVESAADAEKMPSASQPAKNRPAEERVAGDVPTLDRGNLDFGLYRIMNLKKSFAPIDRPVTSGS